MGGGGAAVGRLGDGGGGKRSCGGGGSGGGGGDGSPAEPAVPSRLQLFDTVVDTVLEKLVAAGSYERFASCYRCFYKLQPEVTRSIYEQFLFQLQASIKEEIQEVKKEGKLEMLFGSLDKLVEEAKEQQEPAWRPSGAPEEDARSAQVPFLLKHLSHLRRGLKEREEESRQLAEAVLAGRARIRELQQQIQARREAWKALGQEQEQLLRTFQEPQ